MNISPRKVYLKINKINIRISTIVVAWSSRSFRRAQKKNNKKKSIRIGARIRIIIFFLIFTLIIIILILLSPMYLGMCFSKKK